MAYMFIFVTLATLLSTFLGGFLSKFISKQRKEIFTFFQNFAVGGIIALIFLELLPESVHHFQISANNDFLGALYSLLIIAGTGILFFFLQLKEQLTCGWQQEKNWRLLNHIRLLIGICWHV